jgi:hypothetical protein
LKKKLKEKLKNLPIIYHYTDEKILTEKEKIKKQKKIEREEIKKNEIDSDLEILNLKTFKKKIFSIKIDYKNPISSILLNEEILVVKQEEFTYFYDLTESKIENERYIPKKLFYIRNNDRDTKIISLDRNKIILSASRKIFVFQTNPKKQLIFEKKNFELKRIHTCKKEIDIWKDLNIHTNGKILYFFDFKLSLSCNSIIHLSKLINFDSNISILNFHTNIVESKKFTKSIIKKGKFNLF